MNNELLGTISKNWGWLFALGILFIILGTIGLGATFVFTLTTVTFFGILLLIGGTAQLVDVLRYEGLKSKFSNILIALLYILAGLFILNDPMMASATLTMVIAWSLIAIGIFRIWMAWQVKGVPGWFWPLLGGIAAIVLGIMILMRWPASSVWVIGLFVAIELIIQGWSLVSVAVAARQIKSS